MKKSGASTGRQQHRTYHPQTNTQIMNKPRTRKTNPLNNLNQTQYLTELIKNEPNLETTKPKTDKTIWFRYKHNNIHEQDLEGINRMILYELWKNGQENTPPEKTN